MTTYPRISVIVPSYNQAQYLELTLRSILDQDYPNLELIVIDGGSKDEKCRSREFGQRDEWKDCSSASH